VRLADTARRQHDRRRPEQHEFAVVAVVAEGTADPPRRVTEAFGDRGLGEHLEVAVAAAVLLQRDDLLLQRADELQSRAVADVGKPRILVAAEVALADLAVLGAVEQRTVGLQLPYALRRLLGV